jgi:hypothetical protein
VEVPGLVHFKLLFDLPEVGDRRPGLASGVFHLLV